MIAGSHISFNNNSRVSGDFKSVSRVFSVKYSIVFKVFKIPTPHNRQNPKAYISRQEILFIHGLFNNQINILTIMGRETYYINFPNKINKNWLSLNHENVYTLFWYILKNQNSIYWCYILTNHFFTNTLSSRDQCTGHPVFHW